MKNKTLTYAFGTNICQTTMKLAEVVSRIPFVDTILEISEDMPSYTLCNWYSESKEFENEALTQGLNSLWIKSIIK